MINIRGKFNETENKTPCAIQTTTRMALSFYIILSTSLAFDSCPLPEDSESLEPFWVEAARSLIW